MKSICLLFEVNQAFMHRRYRFFDIGTDHYYYDDYSNETNIRQSASKCYMPAGQLFLKLIEKSKGKINISFALSGPSLRLFEIYAPEVIGIFRDLAQTGSVEFVAQPWPHSLASIENTSLFEEQVKQHHDHIYRLFGQKPVVFMNSELIYSDEIGAVMADSGFKGVITEGARHILGWKSPNFLYCNVINPRLKVFMRNFKLSDDLTFRFSNPNWSEYPLTAEKYLSWLKKLTAREEVINVVIPYETLGILQSHESGIFSFFEKFCNLVASEKDFILSAPSRVINEIQPVSAVSVPAPVSWEGEERDLSHWMGNELQREAFRKLYELTYRISRCDDPDLKNDWDYLQSDKHFALMTTKRTDGLSTDPRINPFGSPYEAFINYMNILSDLKNRLNLILPENIIEKEIACLEKVIREKDEKIEKLKSQLSRLQSEVKPSKKMKKSGTFD